MRTGFVAVDPDGVRRGQPVVGERLDLRDARAVAMRLGPIAQDVAPIEGACLSRDPARGRQVLCDLASIRSDGTAGRTPVEDREDLLPTQPQLGGPRTPLVPESVARHVVLLGSPSLERGDARGST